ncbi:DUF2834 domain-containing protein [Mycolicibacterium vaccae]|uniref:DUF2834 domain-containing protein n=1 Tax=Mycolicibacterium vaccae TaxID=1810 RepID=UPI003D02FBDF
MTSPAPMTRIDKVLCAVYGLIALGALVATWWHNVAFVVSGQGRSLTDFVSAAYANHAAASLTNDVVLVAIAIVVFMVVEARRLGIARVWLYLVMGVFVAISVAFPVFLIVRQITLARRRPALARQSRA